MIQENVRGTLVNHKVTVETQFTYMGDIDPYAIHLRFFTDKQQNWVFDRSLLLGAILGLDKGEGDVLISSDRRKVYITLRSATTDQYGVTISFPRKVLKKFINAAYDLIPAGEESQYLGDPDEEFHLLLQD